ncbi:hypothetical protein ACFX5U_19365 [Sphingobacterium sp. SG20118]|uniref:hypothetical protein n=1 Tax=Sphingobacterium TaxID=28453 RepID=UPI0004F85E17|nr:MULTISPECIES: hypothetical protein [Sphingobacterium]AIM38856.1 hypothetical protein KO02_20725 [Sphingobacterium sp. ML3W]MDH5825163.1 hypothetical protein [Sphingobacterium faecium]
MSISITPLFSSLIDQHTILQIVLQLEIENNNGAHSDHSETGSKFFNSKVEDTYFWAIITDNHGKQKHYLKNEKSIRAFHPSVPTPPPNC